MIPSQLELSETFEQWKDKFNMLITEVETLREELDTLKQQVDQMDG